MSARWIGKLRVVLDQTEFYLLSKEPYQMSNTLTIFDPANVPDHIKAFNEANVNIGDKVSVDSLTYKGKIWTVVVGGTKTPLMKKGDDGDEEPRSTIPIVILDYNKRRGRSYYSQGYVDDRPVIPDCWSPDGITPDPTSVALQSDKCASCPMSVKGSKTTEVGKQTTACQQYRMVAAQLYRKWDMPPLRLRLAITSDYDGRGKENEAKGWYAFQQLMDLLRARGVKHTASVVVRAKFDPAVAYPKVLFSPVGWTTEEEIEILAPISESDAVKQLLSPTFTPNGGDGARKDQAPPADEEPDEDGPAPAPAPAPSSKPSKLTSSAKQAAAAAPEDEDEDEVSEIVKTAELDEDENAEAKAQAQAAEVQAQAQAKQAAKVADARKAANQRKAAAAADDDEITLNAPTAPKATASKTTPKATAGANGVAAKAGKATAAAAPKTVSPAVGAMLQDWEDD